ncbi:hypothetical protein CL614_03440 [archaeon]|nr:hypothetical protein [archaeon]
MKNVLLRAPLLTYSGYGTHSRQIFRWLMTIPDINLCTQILPWGITPWMIDPDIENGLVGEIMSRSGDQPSGKFDVTVQVQLPNEWDISLGKTNIGISAAVETDRCNYNWINCCNRMDHIIVPSHHIKQVLETSGKVTSPLSVVPEAFYDEIISDDIEPIDLELDTDFNFLIVGQLTGNNPENDRKNTFYALKWLCEAFSDDKDVGIVLKTNSGKNTKIDKRVTVQMLEQLLKEIRVGPYPKIHLVHGAMNLNEMSALYRHSKIKALISLTRGEGFGLPLLEASAAGMPIIATNWSAHLDFLSLGKFIPLDYSLQEIDKSRVDNEIFVLGAKWAEPIEDDVKKKVKKFRSSWIKPTEWAKELQPKIIENYSQGAINKSYSHVLGKYF